jgi:hypothetical protein
MSAADADEAEKATMNATSHLRIETFQTLSFRDAPLGAGPESILTIVVMDSGLALRALRNDDT